MDNGRREPRRMRYSLESRLRIVRLIETGDAAGRGGGGVRREPRDGLSALAAVSGRGLAGSAGSALDADPPATPAERGGRGADHRGATRAARGPAGARARCSIGPPRRSARCCAAPAAHDCPAPIASCGHATSASGQASSLHVDIKKLGRFWEVGKRIHRRRPTTAAAERAGATCTSRSTTTPASPTPSCSADERGPSCAAFLRRAHGWYAERGITIERVLTRQRQGLPRPLLASQPATSSRSGGATPSPTAPGQTAKPKP